MHYKIALALGVLLTCNACGEQIDFSASFDNINATYRGMKIYAWLTSTNQCKNGAGRIQERHATIERARQLLTFNDITPGTYTLCGFIDVNGNATLTELKADAGVAELKADAGDLVGQEPVSVGIDPGVSLDTSTWSAIP